MMKPRPPDDENSISVSTGGAALYVRVSSTGQLGRDGDEDGYSIPAQLAATKGP
jgi:hypothetical protein